MPAQPTEANTATAAALVKSRRSFISGLLLGMGESPSPGWPTFASNSSLIQPALIQGSRPTGRSSIELEQISSDSYGFRPRGAIWENDCDSQCFNDCAGRNGLFFPDLRAMDDRLFRLHRLDKTSYAT